MRDRPVRHWLASKFADRTDAAAAEVIDVVRAPLAAAQADDVLGRRHDVLVGDDAGLQRHVDGELLVDLVATDAADVVALRVEEQRRLSSAFAFGHGGRISGTQAAIDVLQRLFGIVGRVLLEALDDRVVVLDVDDLDRLDVEVEHWRMTAWVSGSKARATTTSALARVANLGDEHLGADGFVVEIGFSFRSPMV